MEFNKFNEYKGAAYGSTITAGKMLPWQVSATKNDGTFIVQTHTCSNRKIYHDDQIRADEASEVKGVSIE